MSQAEHDEAAQPILIADDAGFADAVERAVERHLQTLPRADIARASWRDNGAIILVSGWDEAVTLIDRIAPEHLELAVEDPDSIARRVRHAGAIFLGRHTPEAIGDYVAGPNHVLPTARSARFASGLGVLDFMKRTTLVGCDPRSLAALAPSRSGSPKPKGSTRTRCRWRCAWAGRDVAGHAIRRTRIAEITLDEHSVLARSATVENERAAAISDLLKDNSFTPCSGLRGPFALHLAVEENRLRHGDPLACRRSSRRGRAKRSCCRWRRSAASSRIIS